MIPLLLALLLLGCSAAPPPVLAPLAESESRRPVVLVPGVTGAMLRDAETGRVIWGRGADLLGPRDGGHSLARPLSLPPGADSGVEAFAVIEQIRLFGGLVRKPIYGPIARMMEANGYRRGALERPDPTDDFFLFAYDWRDDLTAAATRLVERLEGVRRARGQERLEVDLICQSAGGQICRYVAKYGGAPLAAAEAGTAGPAPTLRVAKVILVGTANGGATRIVRELHRGRRYVSWLGRKIRPEVLFTFPALFQDLPVYRDAAFVDGDGEPLDLDIFAADVWVDNRLSIFSDESRSRLERSSSEGPFGDDAVRRAAAETFLELGRRLHGVLRRDAEGFASRYYSIQNVDDETPDRAVLFAGPNGERRLLFTGDRELRGMDELHAAVTSGGDGHATVASQRWLSPQELDALAAPPLHLRGDHFAMILDRRALEAMLRYLAD